MLGAIDIFVCFIQHIKQKRPCLSTFPSMQHAFSIKANAAWRKWRNKIVKIFAKGWFTLATEATEAES